MQETLSPGREPQLLSFSEFLTALIAAFEKEGLRPCVLRNYEGFPDNNVGSDVDLLISPSELPCAISALRSIEGIRIVGYAERSYVAHVFLEGISTAPGIRAIGVDFIWSLNWKGLPYLPTDTVLKSAIPRMAGNVDFFVPAPTHEAIISLLGSLLIGGWLKEKYFPQVQRTFSSDRYEAIATLLPAFGLKAAKRLVDSVIGGDRQNMLDCVRSLRISLVLSSLPRRPVRGVFGVIKYHVREFAVRCLPQTLETVCVIGPGDCGNEVLVGALIPMLKYSAKVVERRHLRPQSFVARELTQRKASAESCSDVPGGSVISVAWIAEWLVEEYLSQFTKKQNVTLRICESYHYHLLIDPKRHHYGIPRWFAQLARKLLPSPDLWVLLDGSVEAMQSLDPQLSTAEALRQNAAYRVFVKTRKRFLILDGSKPLASLADDAYAAIIDMLAQRTERKLRHRL